jgi:hypothetical protein
LGAGGKVQHLVDSLCKCDKVSRHKFITGTGEFVLVTNIEEFPQPFVGIKAHAIPIGNSNEHEIQKLLHAG